MKHLKIDSRVSYILNLKFHFRGYAASEKGRYS